MSNIDEMFFNRDSKALSVLNEFNLNSEERIKKYIKFCDELHEKILQAQNDNKLPKITRSKQQSNKRIVDVSDTDEDTEGNNMRIQLHDTANKSADIQMSNGKPKRHAAQVATIKNKIVQNTSLRAKMRRPGKNDSEQNVIKIEKISESMLNTTSAEKSNNNILSDVTNESMPPPATKPKRTRKKIKTEESDSNNEENSTNDSKKSKKIKESTQKTIKTEIKPTHLEDTDCIIQEVQIPIVTINDTDSEVDQNENITVNSKLEDNSKSEEIHEDSIKDKKKKPKKQTKTKSKKTEKEKNKLKINKENLETSSNSEMQEDSVYEDALSENKIVEVVTTKKIIKTENNALSIPETNLNITHVIDKARQNSEKIEQIIKETGVATNCTVVLPAMNSTFVVNTENKIAKNNLDTTHVIPNKKLNECKKEPISNNTSNILTDDDDSIEIQTSPVAIINKKQNLIKKQMFSPYCNSPVKKRVEAFEKLGTAEQPTRVTRTKTKAIATEQEQQIKNNTVQETTTTTRIPTAGATKKSKYLTPVSNSKIPSLIPSTEGKQKQNKTPNDSTMKPTRVELQERREEEQKRKIGREDDVKRKKDALLQAKIEEQKRKREEKQLRAQKTREAKEREKEEKIRRMIQEKEEKLQQEEQMKREWMAKKAAEEEKKKKMEEQMLKLKQEKIKQQEAHEKRKKMLNKTPPPLPTNADIDSDDEESDSNEQKKKYHGPLWSQRPNLRFTTIAQRYFPNNCVAELFQMKPQTPDLREIFEIIDERVLRRNSSAVWRTPPRYSMLPKF